MHRFKPEVVDVDRALIERIMQSDDGDVYELVETHISWLLLTDSWAYKIKKPVDLGFLDFRRLEQRKFYCEEEIRLNKPYCPEIYVDVVPIVETAGGPVFGGNGKPLEYAVRMRRFDQAMRLDAQLAAGKLSIEDMRELAAAVAQRHRKAAVLDDTELESSVERVGSFALDNFPPLQGVVDEALVDALLKWTRRELEALQPVLRDRFEAGMYRECHGDLHLANLVRLPSGIALFDCLEFNADLRNTDVMADVAFLVMDLAVREKLALASHFLNRYLEISGDYPGMGVFNLYFTYRCLVRAKVAVIRGLERDSDRKRQEDFDEARRYCALAHRQTRHRRRILVAMHGFSGSGKTWVSGKLMDVLPAIRIRSDIERKRMFGLEENADSESAVGEGIYSSEATTKVYERLCGLAGALLEGGHNVILDASFLRRPERDAVRRVAAQADAAFCQLQVIAPQRLLQRRLARRSAERSDASEAGSRVLEHQMSHSDPLADDELAQLIAVQSDDLDAAALGEQIRSRVDGR